MNIQLRFQRAPEGAGAARPLPPSHCWLNLNTKSLALTPTQKKDPVCLGLAKTIREELTDADRQRLREWFLAVKLDLIETTPISKIDIAGLPCADDGKMVGFVDVFPTGLALYFDSDNEVWAVDEQFCVRPGCTCKETVRSFLKPVVATGGKMNVIRDMPSIRYNYQTHEANPVSRGRPTAPRRRPCWRPCCAARPRWTRNWRFII